MPIKAKDMRKCLLNKFNLVEDRSFSHPKYVLYIDDRKYAVTEISHGGKEISDSILGQMAKQLWVNQGKLKKMVSCQIDKDAYYSHVLNTQRRKR